MHSLDAAQVGHNQMFGHVERAPHEIRNVSYNILQGLPIVRISVMLL